MKGIAKLPLERISWPAKPSHLHVPDHWLMALLRLIVGLLRGADMTGRGRTMSTVAWSAWLQFAAAGPA